MKIHNALRNACQGIDFNQWMKDNTDGRAFKDLHYLSHQRFYYQAQNYPVLRLFITYERLLTEPVEAFWDMLNLIGCADADLDRGILGSPPVNHTFRESVNYDTISGEKCKGLDAQFHALSQNPSLRTKKLLTCGFFKNHYSW